MITGSINGGGHDIQVESHADPDAGPFGPHDNDSEEDSVVTQEQPLKPFYQNPFFGDPFLSAFGFGFPGFGGPQNAPWWKG